MVVAGDEELLPNLVEANKLLEQVRQFRHQQGGIGLKVPVHIWLSNWLWLTGRRCCLVLHRTCENKAQSH